MVNLFRCCVPLLACGLSCLVGCGGESVPAAGRIVFADSQPVRSGKVEFRGKTERVRGSATLDEDGRFRLRGDSGQDGIPPGQYDVIVVQFIVVENRSLAEHGHGAPVPRRYADYFTSGLTAEVPTGGTTDLVVTVERE